MSLRRPALLHISALAVAIALLGATGASGVVLYATDSGSTGSLYTIDTNAGFAVTLVGGYGTTVEAFIGGLEFDAGGTLYGLSATSSAQLYTIDPSNGNATAVGPLNVGFIFEGGIAFDPTDGTLYGVNEGNDASATLVTINTASGAGTVVGQIGNGNHDFAGLAFNDGGQLFGIDRISNALWRIDKSNPAGAGTAQVGASFPGITMGSAGGMTRDAASGVTYCYAGGSATLFSVNLMTGVPTVLANLSNAPVLYSLAIEFDEPTAVEPTTWGKIKSHFR